MSPTLNQRAFISWLTENATVGGIIRDKVSGRWYPVTVGQVVAPGAVLSNLVSSTRDAIDLANFIGATANAARVGFDPIKGIWLPETFPDVNVPLSNDYQSADNISDQPWWQEMAARLGNTGGSYYNWVSPTDPILMGAAIDVFGFEDYIILTTNAPWAGVPAPCGNMLSFVSAAFPGGTYQGPSGVILGYSSKGYTGQYCLVAGNSNPTQIYLSTPLANEYHASAESMIDFTQPGPAILPNGGTSETIPAGTIALGEGSDGRFSAAMALQLNPPVRGMQFILTPGYGLRSAGRALATNLWIHGLAAVNSLSEDWELIGVTDGIVQDGSGLYLQNYPLPPLSVVAPGQWDIIVPVLHAAAQKVLTDPSTAGSLTSTQVGQITQQLNQMAQLQGWLRFQATGQQYYGQPAYVCLQVPQDELPSNTVLAHSSPPVTVGQFDRRVVGKAFSQYSGWLLPNYSESRPVVSVAVSTTTTNGIVTPHFTYFTATDANQLPGPLSSAIYSVDAQWVPQLRQALVAAGASDVEINPTPEQVIANPLFDGSGRRFLSLKVIDDTNTTSLAIAALQTANQSSKKFNYGG